MRQTSWKEYDQVTELEAQRNNNHNMLYIFKICTCLETCLVLPACNSSERPNDRTSPHHRSMVRGRHKKTDAVSPLGALVFFSWILAVQIAGLAAFTKGFFLTRVELEYQSECDVRGCNSDVLIVPIAYSVQLAQQLIEMLVYLTWLDPAAFILTVARSIGRK